MSAVEVPLGLVEAGAVPWGEEGRLRYKAPVGAVGPALRAEAVVHRAALFALVNAGAALPRRREAMSEDLRHEFKERVEPFTVDEVLTGDLGKSSHRQEARDIMRVGGLLYRLGFSKRRVRDDGSRKVRWAGWSQVGEGT